MGWGPTGPERSETVNYRGHFDGASRGNPGPAGAGAVLYCDGAPVWRRAHPLGTRTNNEAEYLALGLLLEEMAARELRNPEICGDSQLVIRQMTGQWKIKEPRLQELAAPLQALARSLGVSFRWVPREENAEADGLSNHALDHGELEQRQGSPRNQKNPGDPAPPLSLKQVSSQGWLVCDGGQEYLVDAAHGSCSCPRWQADHRCRHLEAVKTGRDGDQL